MITSFHESSPSFLCDMKKTIIVISVAHVFQNSIFDIFTLCYTTRDLKWKCSRNADVPNAFIFSMQARKVLKKLTGK